MHNHNVSLSPSLDHDEDNLAPCSISPNDPVLNQPPVNNPPDPPHRHHRTEVEMLGPSLEIDGPRPCRTIRMPA